MKQTLERTLCSVRRLATTSRFPGAPSAEHTMVYKAANLIAAEKVEGDYLEFGVYSVQSGGGQETDAAASEACGYGDGVRTGDGAVAEKGQ